EGKSRLFTIRTTEKQPELVRVALDRLLRAEDGKSLMAGATVTYEIAGPKAELTFSRPTSKTYVQGLLDREFEKAGARRGEAFTITPGGGPVEGRDTRMTVDVSKGLTGLAGPKPDPKELEQFQKVLAEVKQAFDASPEPERLEVFDSQLAS